MSRTNHHRNWRPKTDSLWGKEGDPGTCTKNSKAGRKYCGKRLRNTKQEQIKNDKPDKI